jgi:hypothetical protein
MAPAAATPNDAMRRVVVFLVTFMDVSFSLAAAPRPRWM